VLSKLQTDYRQSLSNIQISFEQSDSRLQRYGARQDLRDEIRSGRPPLDDLNSKFLAIVEKSPFESSDSITEGLLVRQSTVLLYLHESIGFKSFHFHWVPHLLSVDFSKNEMNI
jgi:hypothetical protein